MNIFLLITSRRHYLAAIVSVSLLGTLLSPVTMADEGHAAANLPEVNIVDGFSTLVEAVKPAVVNISVTGTVTSSRRSSPFRNPPPEMEEFFRRFFGDRFDMPDRAPVERKTTAVGSGFIIDASGLVVTNNHVIEDADEIEVVFDDGTRMPARLRGTDSKTDLALLEIDGKEPFPYVIFGDSEQAKVGDWVVAIGNPFGLGGTTTQGIISARGRDIRSGPLDDFIQIDAPINRGNSGGPLFNMKGEVIGINSAIYSPNGGSVGIGFAIPSALASNVISQLQSTGTVKRGYLGVQIQSVNDEIADSLGLEEAQGALITQVIPGSPADAAGLEAGDIVLEFDGKNIPRMRELPKVVALTERGKVVDVVVWRNQKKTTIRVSVGGNTESNEARASEPRGHSDAEDNAELSMLGLNLGVLDDVSRKQYRISEDSEGALIVGVEPGSPAAERGMVRGELITRIGNEYVESPDDVSQGIRRAINEGKQSVLMLVEQAGRVRFIVIPLDL